MKKSFLTFLAIGFLMLRITGIASATMIISDVSITSNSVTFTIDGNMDNYNTPHQDKTFSLEYFGDIFISGGEEDFALNTWSNSVFDNRVIIDNGNTGTHQGLDYTWSFYDSLVGAMANARTITVSTTNNYFDISKTGQIGFYWGLPIQRYTELARVDIIDGGQVPPPPVPEPTTMFLFGTGLVALFFGTRNKKKK